MAALMSREHTGRGQYIDLAQGEAILALASEGVLEYTENLAVDDQGRRIFALFAQIRRRGGIRIYK